MGEEWVNHIFELQLNLRFLTYKYIDERVTELIKFINFAINVYKKNQQ